MAESKVKNLEVFKMSTAEVFAKYPNPGALLRQLEGGRRNNAKSTRKTIRMPPSEMTDKERQERQAKLREYYQKYDLRPANQINAADHREPRAARRLFRKPAAGSDGRFLAESF